MREREDLDPAMIKQQEARLLRPIAERERVITRWLTRAAALAGALIVSTAGLRAEQPYPFEGTWIRADRICSSNPPSARTYTARELSLPNGHCTLRRVAFGSGEWEVFEECRRGEHQGSLTERIRMLGPDSMMIKQQVVRLKIPRGHRFTRCTMAAPQKLAPSGPAHSGPAPTGHSGPPAPAPAPKP